MLLLHLKNLIILSFFVLFASILKAEPDPEQVCDVTEINFFVSQCNGNTFTLRGTVSFIDPPTTGTFTIRDGNVSRSFSAPFVSPISFVLENIPADGLQHFVTASFSGNTNCTQSVGYNAPAGCAITCRINQVTTQSGVCNPATNLYSLSGSIFFDNPPTSGTLSISEGGITQVFNAPFSSPLNYTLNGLGSNGLVHTVSAVFSADPSCSFNANYTAPAACSPNSCVINEIIALPSACTQASNTYNLSGSVSFSNPPTQGTLMLMDGSFAQIFSAPFTNPINFTFTGIPSDGRPHSVSATFSAEPSCTKQANYNAPASCAPLNCDILEISPVIGACEPITNTYPLSGSISFQNPPNTGILTLRDGNVSRSFSAPFTSPINFDLGRLPSDGAQHFIIASFSDAPTCALQIGYQAPASCELPPCNINPFTAVAGTCNPTNNTYSVSGSITFISPPTRGTLTIRDGNISQTFNAPITSPITYTLNGINSDGQAHSVTAQFSDDPSCTQSVDYKAPQPCVPQPCFISNLTAAPGSCFPATNTYSVSGLIVVANAPETGTLTVSDGAIAQIFTAPFPASISYTLSGLDSDGNRHTVTALFSANPACNKTVDYTAPQRCAPIPCDITDIQFEISACDVSTNTYSISGVLSFQSPPSTGTLTVSDGNAVQVFNAPFTSPLNFSLSGLTADGGPHSIIAIFSSDRNCIQSVNYTAPKDCLPPSCSLTSISATPGACTPSTNSYNVTGTLVFSNPPTSGTLRIIDGQKVLSLSAPFVSPLNYTLSGIPSDGLPHVVTADFSADRNCNQSTGYTAPKSCTPLPCEITRLSAIPSACNPQSNAFSLSGSLVFSNPPSGGTLTLTAGSVVQTFTPPFNSPINYTFNGLNSDGLTGTVTAVFSEGNSCSASEKYIAPGRCVPLICKIDALTALPGTCDPLTNKYVVSGTLQFSNPPLSGALTLTDGNIVRTFNAPFVSPLDFNLSGLDSDAATHTIVASFSADNACNSRVSYTAPALCKRDTCRISGLTVEPGSCVPQTNTYTLTGTLTFVNAPASGTLVIRDGLISKTLQAPFTSPISFSLEGLAADSALHTLTASFSSDTSCRRTITYLSPASCEIKPCLIQSSGLEFVDCNSNGSELDASDDFVSFYLNPVGVNVGSGYIVSGDVNGEGVYGKPTRFESIKGAAGKGPLNIVITDRNNPACKLNLTVPNPGTCSCARVCKLIDWKLSDFPGLPLRHALYLYISPLNKDLLNGFDTNEQRYNWENGSGKLTEYDNRATITGTVVSKIDTNYKFEIFIELINPRNSLEWFALGRSTQPENDPRGVDWTYWELSPNSKLIGLGKFAGDVLNLKHEPSDFFKGFQIGKGANDKDDELGISGWFSYEGELQGEPFMAGGDINVDIASCTETCKPGALPTLVQDFRSNLLPTLFVQLNWSFISLGTGQIIVERSIDSLIYKQISVIDAALIPGGTSKYVFIDPEKVLLDTYYYRLKMVRPDGSFYYTNITKVKVDPNLAVPDYVMVPNPIKEDLYITSSFPEKGKHLLRILDLSGREVFYQEYESMPIYTNITTQNLKPGMYFISLARPSGKKEIKKVSITGK